MKKIMLTIAALASACALCAAPGASAQEAELPEAAQELPEDNDNPGFEWGRLPDTKSAFGEEYFTAGRKGAYLKAWPDKAEDLAVGTGKCALGMGNRYELAAAPRFEGEYMIVELARPIEGCSITRGYVAIASVAGSSAGGACELPREVRAMLDTIAYAEGTGERYNYIYTFATFKNYSDHPRRRICSGGLCSTAAGRYQFLTKTWDPLAAALGLRDFTPPSQDKAAAELLRRAGAYAPALKSGGYESFSAAIRKVNRIWASLPGSPYGQHTRSMAELWKFHQAALESYE